MQEIIWFSKIKFYNKFGCFDPKVKPLLKKQKKKKKQKNLK
jgi:hypothetical protein